MQNTVNTGTVANDGTGDTLRAAFLKINDDFTEVFFDIANVASNLSNLIVDVNTFEGVVYNMSLASFTGSNNAYLIANNAYNVANLTFSIANTANGASANSANAYNVANSFSLKINSNYTSTNAAYVVANAAFDLANSLPLAAAVILTQAAFNQANVATIYASDAYNEANAALGVFANIDANTKSAYDFANSTYAILTIGTASVFNKLNVAYSVANGAYVSTNSVYYSMNAAYVVANAAFAKANSKIDTYNGSATGTFTSQGNFIALGSSTLASGTHVLDSSKAIFGKRVEVKANPSSGQSGVYLYDSSGTTLYGYSYANSSGFSTGSSINTQLNFIVNGSTVGYFGTNGNLGVTTGSLLVAGDITGFVSDERLKKDIREIDNPITKVNQLRGITYHYNDLAKSFGFESNEEQIGLLAQDVEKVIPQVVKPAPFDTDYDENSNSYSKSGKNYKTIQYEKVVPLLVEAIKELSDKVRKLEEK